MPRIRKSKPTPNRSSGIVANVAAAMSRRADDIEALDFLADQTLDDGAETAFADMRAGLSRHHELTPKQREWVSHTAEEFGFVYGDPARRNASVPRGREVPLAPVLTRLPLKPPTRKVQA